jgi:hypothetical protein
MQWCLLLCTAVVVIVSGSPCTVRDYGTTSQPQKGACEQNSTAPVGPSWRHLAVAPTPPADWGTRSTRSHLGKRPEHEIPAFCSRRGGPGGAPRSGPGLPERGWDTRGLGGIWPFGDLTIGAHQLALVLVPCQAAEPTLANLRPPEHGSVARTGAPARRPT